MHFESQIFVKILKLLYPLLISIFGGFVGSIITWRCHIDSKKMWRNEIFVKTMQEKLIEFNCVLYENIKNDYDDYILSSLLNNEFNFNAIDYMTFFKNKFKKAKDLENQFIFVKPYLEKCLKLQKKELDKLFICLKTTSLIYGYFVAIQDSLAMDMGPNIDDYFNMEYDLEINEQVIDNMTRSTQNELREKFALQVQSLNMNSQNKDDKFYHFCITQIRDNLVSFNKLINNYMWKEL